MRSAIGAMLSRAELFGTDSRGRRIPKLERTATGLMHVKETRPHALSHTHGLENGEEERARVAALQRFVTETLTAQEQAVYELQQAGEWRPREVHLKGLHEAEAALRSPLYSLVRRSDDPERVGWLAVCQCWVQFTNTEMAARLEISVRQVRRAVESINRKARAAAITI